MTTPVKEIPEPDYLAPPPGKPASTDGDTFVGTSETGAFRLDPSHLAVNPLENGDADEWRRPSPSQEREQRHRLDDELAVLQVERQVSHANSQRDARSLYRSKSRTHTEPVDEFDVATNPLHETAAIYASPQAQPSTAGKFFRRIHQSSFLIRYFTYIAPVAALLLIPVLIGVFLFQDASVGGVRLMWFGVWLEIVWLTLWAGRIAAKMIPWPMGLVASLFANNAKKWRDMGKQLEIPTTLFFWWLGVLVSFIPTMTNHHMDGNPAKKNWEKTMYKIIIAVFVGTTINFIEKIIIQLIAISFHLRTYADRIEVNKFQIGCLTKLYKFSKEKMAVDDSEFITRDNTMKKSGTRTPMAMVEHTQRATTKAFNKVGDVVGKVAGDFTGKKVAKSTHPHQVVLALLHTTDGSQVLARRLYRTFVREREENIFSEDLRRGFDTDEESDAAFIMFDKDLNGDISMEELEAVCVEIGRERKSITASLKDLDSVIAKLDDVLVFVILIIIVIVLVSLLSSSAAGMISSAGSTILALSWLLSATAQEFLQSLIFVFVKHPFDVGDRVSIYGNTGKTLTGDDYFVKEISLLYTEFKKMEGHVVQAPNSYLNEIFILNMRRSGGLAEAIPVIVKFGTTLDQIDSLRQRLLEFVRSEKREYQGNILTELREVTEAHSITLNVVFFYKSNWQNELLRLQRRNKFVCALMVNMQELGIEGPRMRFPGQKSDQPFFINMPGGLKKYTPDPDSDFDQASASSSEQSSPDAMNPKTPENKPLQNRPSILRTGRRRGESVSAMAKRVDFSLGMKDVSSSDPMSDVFEDRRDRVPEYIRQHANQNPIIIEEPEESDDQDDTAKASGAAKSPGSRFSLRRTSTSRRLSSAHSGEPSVASHRNRFLGRFRHSSKDEDETRSSMMEAGLPIPGPSAREMAPMARTTSNNETRALPHWEPKPLGRAVTDFELRKH